MSERRSRGSRRGEPAYMPRVLEIARALAVTPGSLSYIEVGHDDDCPHWRHDGSPCDCNPDVRLAAYAPPMPGRN